LRRGSPVLLAAGVSDDIGRFSALFLAALTGVALAASAADAGQPVGVIALVDSGINPYHVVFRDRSPRAQRAPSTYLPGYPQDALPLRLTLDGPGDYAARVKADCKVWKSVKQGRLYWIPGTKIVGAISFADFGNNRDVDCTGTAPPVVPHVLDNQGHGTMTASRAAAAASWGACAECLVVSVQGVGDVPLTAPTAQPELESLHWLARNTSWIDAESNSWSPFAPIWEPTSSTDPLTDGPDLDRAVEASARRHLSFVSSGNGAAGRAGVVGHPTSTTGFFGPSVIKVGGVDSGRVVAWPGFPAHVASDACANWAASNTSISDAEDTLGSGTSSASPFAAGIAVGMLREARGLLGDRRSGVRGEIVARGPAGAVPSGPLADGRFTLAEWRAAVLHVATPRPVAQPEDGPPCEAIVGYSGAGVTPTALYYPTPVRWSDLSPAFPGYLLIGYGALDRPAQRLASAVLRGAQPLPARPEVDAFFAGVAPAESAVHALETLAEEEPALAPDPDVDPPPDADEEAAKARAKANAKRRAAKKRAACRRAARAHRKLRGCPKPKRRRK
jgi:Subtilase family